MSEEKIEQSKFSLSLEQLAHNIAGAIMGFEVVCEIGAEEEEDIFEEIRDIVRHCLEENVKD